MAAFYDTFATPGVRTHECAPAACPVCGGLECLCRPRFFAGQLLTDEDLNLLDRYIVGKNKLHNRYLHGWGVVCGLEVVCHHCNMVTVRPGYALSPCGEDIVVCKEAVVDVCALIKKCKDEERRRWECEPLGWPQGNDDCRDAVEEWVLTIRYEEKPSRGVTALKGGGPGPSCSCGTQGCGCGCAGGSGSQGCGCGTHGGGKKGSAKCGCKTPQAGKGVPAQCEPTVTCEGYVFEVCKVTPKMRDDGRKAQRDLGALGERAFKCYQDFRDAMPKVPSANSGNAAWHQYCCDIKEALLEYLASHPVYDCTLAEKIAQFQCPPPPDPNTTAGGSQGYPNQVDQAVKTILAPVAAEYIRYCNCSALLPPCPAPVEDPRVPLATITVRRRDCRIIRVCNLSHRKFVTTFPNLQYWLSSIPFVRQLRRVLELLCCREFPTLRPATRVETDRGETAAAGGEAPRVVVSAEATQGTDTSATSAEKGGTTVSSVRDTDFAKIFAGAWRRRGEEVDSRTLFLGAIGATDEKGQPYMSEAEMNDPFLFLALNQVARPVFARSPSQTPSIIRNLIRLGSTADYAAQAAPSAMAEGAGEVEELRAQLAELQETVRRQQERIDELDSRAGGGQ